MDRAAALALVLLLAACGGDRAVEEDVVYLDVPWRFGKDLVDDGEERPGDAEPTDALAADTPRPEDTLVRADGAEIQLPEDTSPPEDIQLKDVGPCDSCPPDYPNCVGGVCKCTPFSCTDGTYCSGSVCVPCTETDPAHCGPDCLLCSGATPHCQAGACVICNTPATCGPACEPCGGALAHCTPDGAGCVQCSEDAHCSAGEHCTEAMACVQNFGAEICTTDAGPSANKCSQAVIVGRVDAADGGAAFSGDTDGSSDDDDLSGWSIPSKCTDAGEDHFYRIWLRPGETIAVQLDVQENYFDAMLKLYEGTECDDDDAGLFGDNDADLVDCWDNGNDGDDESFVWVAPSEGWHTVVVDGREEYDFEAWPDDGDYGEYSITIILTCTKEDCCCN